MSVATNCLSLGSSRVLPDGVFNARISSVTVSPLSLLEIPTVFQKRFRVASAPKARHEWRVMVAGLQCSRFVSDTTVPSGCDAAVANALEDKLMLEPHENLTRAAERGSSLRYMDKQD